MMHRRQSHIFLCPAACKHTNQRSHGQHCWDDGLVEHAKETASAQDVHHDRQGQARPAEPDRKPRPAGRRSETTKSTNPPRHKPVESLSIVEFVGGLKPSGSARIDDIEGRVFHRRTVLVSAAKSPDRLLLHASSSCGA